jgi:hypothetical protein
LVACSPGSGGTAGPRGPAGPQGAAGPQGVSGPQGTAGAGALSVYDANGVRLGALVTAYHSNNIIWLDSSGQIWTTNNQFMDTFTALWASSDCTGQPYVFGLDVSNYVFFATGSSLPVVYAFARTDGSLYHSLVVASQGLPGSCQAVLAPAPSTKLLAVTIFGDISGTFPPLPPRPYSIH